MFYKPWRPSLLTYKEYWIKLCLCFLWLNLRFKKKTNKKKIDYVILLPCNLNRRLTMCFRFFCGNGTITAQTHKGNQYVLQNIVFVSHFSFKKKFSWSWKDTHSFTLCIITYKNEIKCQRRIFWWNTFLRYSRKYWLLSLSEGVCYVVCMCSFYCFLNRNYIFDKTKKTV